MSDIDQRLRELEDERLRLLEIKNKQSQISVAVDPESITTIQKAMDDKVRAETLAQAQRLEKIRLDDIERQKQHEIDDRRISAEMPIRLEIAESIWNWITEFRKTDLCKQLFAKHEYIVIYRSNAESWFHHDIYKHDTAIYQRVFAKWAGTVTHGRYQNANELAKTHEISMLRSMLNSFRPGGEVYQGLQRQALL